MWSRISRPCWPRCARKAATSIRRPTNPNSASSAGSWTRTAIGSSCGNRRRDDAGGVREGASMFAIKTELTDVAAQAFAFREQKTMYGGKHIAQGDTIFIFASENEGGPGLVAAGIVTSA